MKRSLVLVSTALLFGVLLLGGCGDDDTVGADDPVGTDEGADTGGDGAALEVVARDIEFGETTYGADAGGVEVRYVNEGDINHTLLIEDVDGFKLDVAANGDEDLGTVELEPGTYTLFCDVPGHRDAGMEATLEVS